MRRTVIVNALGEREAERYDKLQTAAQVRMFLETFWKDISVRTGLQRARDPNKEKASAMLAYFLLQTPKPSFLDASFGAMMKARMLGQLARPEEDQLAQEGLRDARDLIAAVSPPDRLDQTERQFQEADPVEKTAMFLDTVRVLLNNRIWPTAYLLYHADASPDIGREFVGTLGDPSAAEGWEKKDLRQRTELEWQTLQILMTRLELLLKEDVDPALEQETLRALNTAGQGMSGVNGIRRAFGTTAAESARDPQMIERWARAAAVFRTAWLIALAICY